ncbi:hypothetical protein J6590_087423 [Homalodisca vitripennis]|nr:hypothetical protein J6590_087423 [Homalodisca vitripennis]
MMDDSDKEHVFIPSDNLRVYLFCIDNRWCIRRRHQDQPSSTAKFAIAIVVPPEDQTHGLISGLRKHYRPDNYVRSAG